MVAVEARSSRPMRADAVRNRQRVLDAARVAFAQSGVTASLDDISRAAGVGPGTLYRHFPTRDHLVLAVIDEGLWEIAALGAELRDDDDPVAAFQRWLASYVAQAGMFDGLARTLVTPPEADSDGKDACRAAQAAGADLITCAVNAREFGADTHIDDVLDMAAAIVWVGEQPDRDQRQQARLLRILVDGLRIPHSPR